MRLLVVLRPMIVGQMIIVNQAFARIHLSRDVAAEVATSHLTCKKRRLKGDNPKS